MQREKTRGSVEVENIGGIDQTQVDLSPGVNVLSGRNATNRTSFLRAILMALGSDETALKGDADEGYVELTLGGETYTRTLERKNGRVTTDGDPYLSDPEILDLFGALLEDNEARRTVEQGTDFREIIMRPVDTDEIQRRIDRLLDERERITDEIEEIDSLSEERTKLEKKRQRIEDRIEETREKLKEKREEIEAADGSVEDTRKEKEKIEAHMSDLQSARSRLEDVRHQLETERESLASLREEQSDLADELDDLPDTPAGEIDEIESRLQRLRGRKEELGSTISELQNVVSFNEEMLEGDDTELVESLAGNGDTESDDEGAITDQLLDDDQTVSCWTCGSAVEMVEIEETVDQLRSLRQSKFAERNEIDDQIDELKSEQRSYRKEQQRREDITRKLDRIEEEIEEREERIEQLTEERAEYETEVEDTEATVDELQAETESEILERHKEANQLEFELDQHRQEHDEVEERIAEIEDRLGTRDELEAEREQVKDQLSELRTHVERIEERAIEEFNTHMENVLDVLEYANIERIWIERKEREVREGRRKVSKSVFDLHLVRTSESGATYEDTVDHLSESEREVTGLVFSLAGYLAHEVYEQIPAILLDSLEAIDSDRIAALIEYLEQYADNLVVALLPEDAAALPDDYHYVESI
ncbi:archaea-specific SMC-related protein [Halorientalis halophila]|uniref:archaea-specific SMC-related protein n=1 Tax=Halorientalis halophila TaxID=3108499 RepID=UPI00300A66EC